MLRQISHILLLVRAEHNLQSATPRDADIVEVYIFLDIASKSFSVFSSLH